MRDQVKAWSGQPIATGRRALTLASVLGALCLIPFLALASPAQAVEKHAFDPVLSLEGNCNGQDGTQDPGCPYSPPPAGPQSFKAPCGTAVDPHGNVYVANPGEGGKNTGRIDVFDPEGKFLTEILDEEVSPGHHSMSEPCDLAVDSEGNVYSWNYTFTAAYRFEPASYPPQSGTEYDAALIYDPYEHGDPFGNPCLSVHSVAVDPSNGHLYVGHGCLVEEYGSAAEGSPLIREDIGLGVLFGMTGINVYGKNHDVYVAIRQNAVSAVAVFDGSDAHIKCEVDGSETPAGSFDFGNNASIAVDQANGDFYVMDSRHAVVDQFAVEGEECKYIGRLPQPPQLKADRELSDIAVDNPIDAGEAGYDSPNEGYVYVTSGSNSTNSHLYAFKPRIVGAPEVRAQAAIDIGEGEAVLRAELNPNSLDTSYRFEYTTQAAFEDHGYEGATSIPVPDADAGAGGAFALVSEPATGLEPGTVYRFRLTASNCEAEEADPGECMTEGEGNPGGEGEDSSFATYASLPIASPCSNATLRTGLSATLPDCRAYELVTPSDTNGRIPTMTMLGENFGANGFNTSLASADGKSVVFGSNGGSLPGVGGSGYQDTYRALRDEAGWQTEFTGMSGVQAPRPKPGGISPDHGYAFWYTERDAGSLATDGYQFLSVPSGGERSPNCAPAGEPEGRFEWVGCGSLGFDPYARGLWIGPGGGHVVFVTGRPSGVTTVPVRLEPCAPPSTPSEPTRAIYDRTPGGATRCVAVPPAGASAETKAKFEDSPTYLGTSADGSAVAFALGGTMYVRVDNTETLEVANGKMLFGGISADGDRVFYLKDPSAGAISRGEIFACDLGAGSCAGPAATHEPTQIGSDAESTFVNVSEDGSHVYFVSKKILSGEESEWGEKAKAGEENLYVWDGSGSRFIALLDPLDVSGESSSSAGTIVGGLGLWAGQGSDLGSAFDPSRTSPGGGYLLFESQADLTDYESDGYRQVYRYDAGAPVGERLRCVSCNPTGVATASDARLQSDPSADSQVNSVPPVNELTPVANVSSDGTKAFFQSAERLVSADLDGMVDVYQWETQGTGGCQRRAGCLALISGGESAEDDFLYAATPDGHDVFILSADSLLGRDPDGTPSIYDARIGGGFPEPLPPSDGCLGETCQPGVTAPIDPTPATSNHKGPGNLSPGGRSRGCPKGRRKVRKAGKTRCVKRQAKRHRTPKHRSHDNGRAAR